MEQFIINCLIVFFLVMFFSCLYTIVLNDTKHWNGLDNERNDTYEKFANRFYYTVSVLSLTGSKEMSPKTVFSKSITMIQMLFVIYGLVHLITKYS